MSHWLEDYFNNQIINTFTCAADLPSGSFPWVRKIESPNYPLPWNLEIKKIIFNGPATIILWTDNTKTVVKCDENEEFDPEKGVAMCIWKKFLPKQYGRKASNFFEYDPKTDSRSCRNCKHFRSFKPFTNIPFTGSPCYGCISRNLLKHYEPKETK